MSAFHESERPVDVDDTTSASLPMYSIVMSMQCPVPRSISATYKARYTGTVCECVK